MAFLGASSVSAAAATRRERLYLSSSQEAMEGEGFGAAGTLLGNGSWALREGARPRLRAYPLHSPLGLSPWPCSLQVHILASSHPRQISPLLWGLFESSPSGPFLSVLSLPFLCLGPAAFPKTKDLRLSGPQLSALLPSLAPNP